jgi:hypothetical protein
MARRIHERRARLNEWTSDDDAQEVWQGIVNDAKPSVGDPIARKLFADYIWGRPSQPLELAIDDSGSVDVNTLASVIMKALEPFPEAKYAVAAALHGARGDSHPTIGAPSESSATES